MFRIDINCKDFRPCDNKLSFSFLKMYLTYDRSLKKGYSTLRCTRSSAQVSAEFFQEFGNYTFSRLKIRKKEKQP